MALINCPECGKEISDSVERCINCGYENSASKAEKTLTTEKKKINKIKLFIFSAIGVVIIALIIVLINVVPIINVKNMLQGTWVYECTLIDVYTKISYTFDGDSVTYTTDMFGIGKIDETGTYTICDDTIHIKWDSEQQDSKYKFVIEDGELLFDVDDYGKSDYKHYK